MCSRFTSEEETARVQSRIDKIVNRLPGLVYRSRIEEDFNMVLEYASKGSETLLGIPAEDLIEKNVNIIERMTVAADYERLIKTEHDSIVAHEPYQIIYRLELPSGQIKWIWDQGEPIYDEDGKPIYLEGIMLDVSEQKFQELAIQEEYRLLKMHLEHIDGLGEMVGRSEAMHKVYNLILKAAESESSVIIYGETGCGKELVAKAIHNLSARKGNYIPVNCGAIPENLLESEFFGHSRGAFTGALNSNEGFVSAADKGTLFLDEVGELPLQMQVKFLRVLETKTYTPLGCTKPKQSSFRLIAATNRNLEKMVNEQQMRADFYYRVNVLSITVPPLRERSDDIPLLIDNWCKRYGISLDIPHDVRLSMARYNWPGNVRELHNFLARYATFGRQAASFLEQKPSSQEQHFEPGQTLEEATKKLEQRMIIETLERCHWHRGKTAQQLGLTIRTLQRKMKSLGITAMLN